jgi:phosphoglycolate phosphatase-like HAD superfamily hydrolase
VLWDFDGTLTERPGLWSGCVLELLDDTLPALRATRAAGWRNVVLSNHVPELPAIVAGLGLDGELDAVFSSARAGAPRDRAGAIRPEAAPARAAGTPRRSGPARQPGAGG